MKENLTSLFSKLVLLLLLGVSVQQSIAQSYLFYESFAKPNALATSAWQAYSPNATIARNKTNGYQQAGEGSLHVSFGDMLTGDVDTLTLGNFPATSFGDSVIFDHAHRALNTGVDSMAIWYSTDNGTTYNYLISYNGDATPSATTLSTVPSYFKRYTPASAADWAHKGIELPVGTNKIQFVFYHDANNASDLYLDNIIIGQDPLFCAGVTPYTSPLASSALVCRNSPFSISPDSVLYNPYFTYQWQQSLDNGVTDMWTDISNTGGINSPDLFLTSVTTSMWYRLVTTCPSTFVSTTSTSMNVVLDSFYNCYCHSNLGGGCTAWITNVSINGTDLNNTSACSPYTHYAPSLTTTDSITAGQLSTPLNVSIAKSMPWFNARVGVWIDYDHSGTFDVNEFEYVNDGLSGSLTTAYTLRVPVTALSGYTGMRVRVIESFTAPFDGTSACMTLPNGETEDYLIYINPAPVCNGIPAVANIAASKQDICRDEQITITASGLDFGAGISYEWEQSNDDGVTDPWMSVSTGTITGQYTQNLEVRGLTDTIYYRFKTVCSNTPDSSYSSSVVVNVKPIYLCYCTDGLGGSGCNPSTPYISNVKVSGSLLDNTTGCSPTTPASSSYSFFDITPNATDTFDIEEMITLEVTNTQAANKIGVWIDYNQDGVYSALEYTMVTPSSTPGVPSSVNIIIPAWASVGYTGMRVRNAGLTEVLADYSACAFMAAGETEDYVIYLQPAAACSGIPNAGTITTAQQSVCAGNTATLEVLGASYGNDITYQWQDSTATTTWADVTTGSGANTRIYTTNAITDTVYYRLKTTCVPSGLEAYSDTAEVIIKPYYECYCSSSLGGGSGCAIGEYISEVAILGGNLDNVSTCATSNNGDDNYTYNIPTGTATDTLTIGELFNLGVRYNGGSSRIGVWVDYDHSGTYDKNEYTLLAESTSTGSMHVKRMEIPLTAIPGLTGMRIRAISSGFTLDSSQACANLYSPGEVEDYVILIENAPDCAGSPVAGTIPSSYVICANKAFAITALGATYNNGITYQWEKSNDKGVTDPWSDVTGQTTHTLNVSGITMNKYFRLKVLCTITMDSTYTNEMQMVLDSFYTCYDAGTDLGGSQCDPYDQITGVKIWNTTLDNSGSGCNATPYGARTTYPASGSTTATVLREKQYQIDVTSNLYYGSSVGVWIDFNRNGSFDSTEFTLIDAGGSFTPGTVSSYITIPPSAVVGLTGMRIRTNYPISHGYTMDSTVAASTFIHGETEDYVINIDTLKPVSGVITNNVGNTDITISWNNGNGDARLVIAKEISTPLTDPVNGNYYSLPDNIFASGNGDSTAIGNYVVYNSSTDTFVTVTNLNPLTQYDFYVYEYMYAAGNTLFLLPGQTTSGTTTPVHMLSFNAAKKQHNVELNWSTASETNNKGFAVERLNGTGEWIELGFVDGKKNSSMLSNYTYTDHSAFTNSTSTLYYRLRQEDYDGHTSYSSIVSVSVEVKNTTSINVFPNPFVESLTVAVQSEKQVPLHITVKDMFGKTVTETTTESVKGNTIFTLDQLSYLPAGVYFLQVDHQGEIQNFKVTKIK